MKKTNIRLITIALMMGIATLSANAETLVRRMSQDEATRTAVSKFQPEYPAVAKQLKLEGAVQVEASIDEQGAVESVKVMSGNVVLANSAVSAVKRWKFSPAVVDGKPARAIAILSFSFKL